MNRANRLSRPRRPIKNRRGESETLAQSIEAAQNGVLDAILELHSTKLFPNVIDDLLNSVFPHYLTPSTPLDWGIGQGQGVVEGQNSSPPQIMSWGQRPDDRDWSPPALEIALQAWARGFRLTHDLSETGECLPWTLKFGRELCDGKLYRVPESHEQSASSFPIDLQLRREGFQVPDPNPGVKFSAYVNGVKSMLKAHYAAVRRRERSKPPKDKRNRDHYKWFVLHVCGCGKFKLPQIADMLDAQVQDDAIRKGFATVCDELGLQRK
jgi:hypothetical protein